MSELTKSVHPRVATEVPRELGGGRPSPGAPAGGPPVKPRHRRINLRRAVAAAVVVLAVAGWAVMARQGNTRQATPDSSPTSARAQRRDFLRTVRLSGTVEAVQARAILAPQLAGSQVRSLVITKLAAAGTKVKRSDLLVEFDRQGQIKEFLDKQAEYSGLVDQIASKKAEEEAARAKDETDLKQAEDDMKKAELEMLKNPILSPIDAEKNQETLDEARANLKQLRATFDLKRRAAQAGIRILEIQRDRARQSMLHAKRNEEQMSVHSPMDGTVVLNAIWKEGRIDEVQEGDEVRPGVSFMQVVNPSAMQVRVLVDQADVLALRVGQAAQVRLDAYPELVFPGKLEQLAPIGENGRFSDKLRTFAAVFSIQGSEARLMPDLTAAVDVELEHLANALVVPHDSVIEEKGESYVWLKRSLSFEKHPVKIGPQNDFDVVVESGLQVGDVVETGRS
jgi:HlyD family secretion protein